MKQPQEKEVLIIEDDIDFAALIDEILSEAGFRTTVSFDGEDALQRLRYRSPDLVTLDIHLPRRSGVLLYREMKSDEQLRDIPIIIITGLTQDRDIRSMLKSFLEADHLPPPQAQLEKPFKKEELLGKVQELCGPTVASS